MKSLSWLSERHALLFLLPILADGLSKIIAVALNPPSFHCQDVSVLVVAKAVPTIVPAVVSALPAVRPETFFEWLMKLSLTVTPYIHTMPDSSNLLRIISLPLMLLMGLLMLYFSEPRHLLLRRATIMGVGVAVGQMLESFLNHNMIVDWITLWHDKDLVFSTNLADLMIFAFILSWLYTLYKEHGYKEVRG